MKETKMKEIENLSPEASKLGIQVIDIRIISAFFH